MAKGLITRAYLEDTADAIRVLRGESDTYTPDEFSEKILDAIPDVEVTDSIVSISDAAAYPAEGLEFAIEPVQDLHGYDRPWPAGGGKNLFQTTMESKTVAGITYTVNSDGSISVSGTASGGTSVPIGEAIVNSSMGTVTISGIGTATNISWANIALKDVSNNILYLVTSGSAANAFTVDLSEYQDVAKITCALKRTDNITTSGIIKPQVELGSTATSYEPYSNICPISGWTGVQGERTGKNLVFAKIERSNINANGTIQQGSRYDLHIAEVKIGKTYCITTQDEGAIYGFFTAMPAQGSVSYNGERIVTEIMYFTAPITGYVVFRSSNGYATPQLELGSTATTYEPYTGTSIPITFPTAAGTVYGCKVDVVNGKLLAYPEYDSYNGETLTGKWISSMDAYAAGTTPTIGAQVVDLSGVGTEYDITPQQVQMLLGDNNVWCDTGDTTLEYKVDLSRYIAKLQAQATPQLSLSRQVVSLEEPRDVEEKTDEDNEDSESIGTDDIR